MKVILATFLLLLAGSAWAESTEADWTKHAQPLVDVFARCTRAEVARTWKSTAPADKVAASAVATCEDKLEALRPVLVEPPFNASADVLDATLKVVRTEMLDAAKADVEQRRKDD